MLAICNFNASHKLRKTNLSEYVLKNDGLTFADFMPNAGEDFRAERGTPLATGTTIARKQNLIEAIQDVYDPEIPVNLWDLGLIYRLDIDEFGDVSVDMTLTAPGCPVAGQMPAMVAEAVVKVSGVGRVTVQLVWEPKWTKDKMSDDARLLLDL